MQMNPAQARVVDPVLSTAVRGLKWPDLIGHGLFPRVPVTVRGGKRLEFGKDAFRLYNTRRAPGAATKRVQFGFEGKPYALTQDALDGQVPREISDEAAKVPGVNMQMQSARNTMRLLQLGLEHEQAQLARDPANYDADHKIDLSATPWTDGANDPEADIDTGKEAVADYIGMEPNTLLLSRRAFRAAKRNAKVKEQFKYTSSRSVTVDMLKEYFEVANLIVGRGMYFDDDDASQDLWGLDAILAYVAVGSESNAEPSFGYTYNLEGNPFAEEIWFDKSTKSWITPVTYERAPEIVGATAGYLLQGVATPAE